MKEKNIQTIFGNYLKENPPTKSYVYELKLCKGKALPFNAVAEHQVDGLLQAQRGLYHRIADSPFGGNMKFTQKKPFDCLFIKTECAYVAVLYYVPRKKKFLHLIKIEDFIYEKETSDRKSLTEEVAREIAIKTIQL